VINPNDQCHVSARGNLRRLPMVLVTNEPVLTEASDLLRREACDGDEVFALIKTYAAEIISKNPR
jgi:hypothetical protein